MRKHAKKIALVMGAIFIFAGGVALGGGVGFPGNLSASLVNAWDSAKGAFSRTPVAEYSLFPKERGSAESGSPAGGTSSKECDFDADEVVNRSVILSEIAWMGSRESYRAEWIELNNRTDKTTSLSGWKLRDESGKVSHVFPSSASVPPHGFLVLVKKGTSSGGIKVVGEFSGSIRNSDQTLKVFDQNCMVQDSAVADPSWPAGDNDTKQTMERNPKTLLWHTATDEGGTPGKENSAGFLPATTSVPKAVSQRNDASSTGSGVSLSAVAGTSTVVAEEVITPICAKRDGAIPTREMLINEVAWAGTASDKTSHEWIELKNKSSQSVSLKGWQIMNRSRSLRFVFKETTISKDGFAILERTDDETLPDIDADVIYVGALKNSDESLQLFDESCNLSDEVEANTGTSKAWPAGSASPEYRSMERGADFTWHSFAGSAVNGISGTPRKENTILAFAGNITGGVSNLSVSKTGTGSGTIVSEPTGIACGSVCMYAFKNGAEIKLTANPDTDSRFMGWGGCVGGASCSIAVSGDMAIAGEFQKVSAPLSIVLTPPVTTPTTAHLLIEKLQVSGSSANDEYVSIFNPSDIPVPLAGWSVQYRGSGAASFSKKNFESTHSLAPGASFTVAHSPGSADMTHSSFAFSSTGGTVFLVSTTTLLSSGSESGIVDKVAYGTGTYLFPEGISFPTTPPASQTLSRKSFGGVLQDTDDNSADFEIK